LPLTVCIAWINWAHIGSDVLVGCDRLDSIQETADPLRDNRKQSRDLWTVSISIRCKKVDFTPMLAELCIDPYTPPQNLEPRVVENSTNTALNLADMLLKDRRL